VSWVYIRLRRRLEVGSISTSSIHSLASFASLASVRCSVRSICFITLLAFCQRPSFYTPESTTNMKFFAASLLATLAVATPIVVPSNDLTARQLGMMTSNDVKSGSSSSCPKAIFIFARASGEQGNMVRYSLAFK
jgi:hypothetical protein